MKAALLVAILVTVSTSAQVLRQIDPHQIADVNSKTVDMPTVGFGTVSQPTSPQPISPVSNQMRERARTVEAKSVETSLLSYSSIPTANVPQQNFSAKRAAVAGSIPSVEPVKSTNAKINKRVIRPFTPTGNEELKKQLNEPH